MNFINEKINGENIAIQPVYKVRNIFYLTCTIIPNVFIQGETVMVFKNIVSPKYIIQNYPVLMELIDGSEFDLTLDVLDLFILWMIYEKSNTMKSPFKAYIRSFKKESSIPFSVDQNGKIILLQ